MARAFGAFLSICMTAAGIIDFDDLCYCSRCGDCNSAIATEPNFMSGPSACDQDRDECDCVAQSTDCCECTVPGAPHTCAGAGNCFDPTAGCEPLHCVLSTTCVMETTLEQLNAPACLGGTCILDYDLCLKHAAAVNTLRLRSSHLMEHGPGWRKAQRHRHRHHLIVLSLSLVVAATAACCIARHSLSWQLEQDDASKVPLSQDTTLSSYGTPSHPDLEPTAEDTEAHPPVAPAQ